MKKIAIIGAGIVGSTVAYYLSKSDMTVTIFDEGHGQATKAAAGIICPWFSRRRHKAWYRLARSGADFYQELLSDLKNDGIATDFYDQSGALLLKSRPEYLEELRELAESRLVESPLIGSLSVQTLAEAQKSFPDLAGFDKGILASGAARVEGSQLTETLIEASGFSLLKEKAELKRLSDGTYDVNGQVFDSVLLACGAWLPDILEPLGYQVDVSPQKGQLRDYYFDDLETGHNPVIIPEGEIDVIPFAGGKVSVGASHEKNMGFDLTVNERILADFEVRAQDFFPKITEAIKTRDRVGIRAYTEDFCPFIGEVPGLKGVYAVSGLGSSGLTTGPLLGKMLSQLVMGQQTALSASDYLISRYIKK
ncbi:MULTISPECIES: NAD(P)/FAD-dependent oxidoreductase [Streptococcus]|uniref:NAD(P)/FAD-dependent oxidoreductase n=1 Tax=Streptococcus caledonicus TaxID=2614158 RepID=A0ABW0UFE3_9STRE|nr:FAD-dependent oxidoreductase [Streptococcus sp. S784/96/1]